MCLSYDEDQLWIGDKEGLVHLVDATDGDFDIVEVLTNIVFIIFLDNYILGILDNYVPVLGMKWIFLVYIVRFSSRI